MRIPMRYLLTNFDPHRGGGGTKYRGDASISDRRGSARINLFIRIISTQTGSTIWDSLTSVHQMIHPHQICFIHNRRCRAWTKCSMSLSSPFLLHPQLLMKFFPSIDSNRPSRTHSLNGLTAHPCPADLSDLPSNFALHRCCAGVKS
jgi:hypothetical protein